MRNVTDAELVQLVWYENWSSVDKTGNGLFLA
jgi:hypothetical protein